MTIAVPSASGSTRAEENVSSSRAIRAMSAYLVVIQKPPYDSVQDTGQDSRSSRYRDSGSSGELRRVVVELNCRTWGAHANSVA